MRLYPFIILLSAAALSALSCSSNRKLVEEDLVNNDVPMVFGTSFSQAEAQETKAPLESNFKVGTWKSFGLASQQVVMDGYEVDYDANATQYKWNYVDVNGQPQRYWDLGAFPYEFRAISPYSSAYTISADGITLDASSKPFQAQTYINETYNVAAADGEPAVMAHVQRRLESGKYADYDIIRNVEINDAAKNNAVREVHLPFHHLISKIGFRLFINDPQPSAPDYKVYLKSITISVVNADKNFITASTTYTATNDQGLGKGSFTNNTTQTGEYTLLQHGDYTDVDFRQHLSKETAYDLCPDFMQQIPQGNVKLRVQLNMETDHITAGTVDGRNPFDFDVLLSLDKTNTKGDLFTWSPDTKYIYYLHIPNLHGHEIYVNTCAILPWDDVQTADIPIEL